MLTAFLQDRAALYVAGAMPAAERENFEVIVEFHGELRELVAGMQEAMTAMALKDTPSLVPPPALKTRLLGALEALPPEAAPEGRVVTDAAGCVEWVNSGFTSLCGYSLSELKGRKPGQLLQGPDTDRAEVERIRAALRTRVACEATLVNYHKDGTRYRVGIRLAPILDDDNQPVWFVAREHKISEAAV
jgi:PAS domain S-box-containing protein